MFDSLVCQEKAWEKRMGEAVGCRLKISGERSAELHHGRLETSSALPGVALRLGKAEAGKRQGMFGRWVNSYPEVVMRALMVLIELVVCGLTETWEGLSVAHLVEEMARKASQHR